MGEEVGLPFTFKWVLHHDLQWTDMRKVAVIDSATTFWRLFHAMRKVSQMAHKTNLRVFREGVEPTREDPANCKGGMWSLQFFRGFNVDKRFLCLLLDVLGGTLDRFDINGVELNVRDRGHRVNVWTTGFDVGFADVIFAEPNGLVSVQFKLHEDIMSTGSTYSTASAYNWEFKPK